MATESLVITDHAAEAAALLKAYVGHPEDLTPAELFAYAQVHATLAAAAATDELTAETQLASDVLSVDLRERIGGELAELRAALPGETGPGRAVLVTRTRGYTVAVGALIPGLLWAVDVYFTADPERGEGPASFLSWGRARRALDRGTTLADQLADEAAR